MFIIRYQTLIFYLEKRNSFRNEWRFRFNQSSDMEDFEKQLLQNFERLLIVILMIHCNGIILHLRWIFERSRSHIFGPFIIYLYSVSGVDHSSPDEKLSD